MIEGLVNSDVNIAEFFAHSQMSPFLDKVMIFITSLGDTGIFWIVCGVILLIFKKTRTSGVALLFSLSIAFLLSQFVLKELVSRPRPFEAIEGIELLIGIPHGSSFPSSHATTSFASAMSLFCFNKIYGTVALVLAALIAFSRVYLCVHFLSDVIFGAILGITLGFILTRMLFFKKDSEVSSK